MDGPKTHGGHVVDEDINELSLALEQLLEVVSLGLGSNRPLNLETLLQEGSDGVTNTTNDRNGLDQCALG